MLTHEKLVKLIANSDDWDLCPIADTANECPYNLNCEVCAEIIATAYEDNIRETEATRKWAKAFFSNFKSLKEDKNE